MLFLVACVGSSLTVQAKTKKKQAANKKTSSAKASGAKASGKTAKLQARRGKSGKGSAKAVAAQNTRKGRSAQADDDKKVQALLNKRGKLTKAERRQLAAYKSAGSSKSARSRRARARAAQLARIRAVRARDEALRNITNSNIEKDNSAGEDLEIRQAAINALNGRSGTVVVMDPTNGRVFSIVNQHMALGSPVKPCSTVKMIVGLAALHESVFDPNQDMRSAKYGSLNLTDALAHSDNPFFQSLGRLLGYDRVMKYAGDFGFGQKTGVNYPGESAGFLPEDETSLYCSHGDGFGVTAMQLAAFTAAIANGGTLYTPRVPRTAEDAENFVPEVKHQIQMTPEDRTRMLAGMIGAVNYGTAKRAYNSLAQVAGKTGTCTGDRDKLRLFTSFSSVDNPRLVVTVITTDSNLGGHHASEIAGRVYAAVSPRFFREKTVTSSTTSAEISVP
ncbi:MAG TPA: penicillin-binding transpeptidase domain-containing protein [Blastocatellia bacterium]|nr:penicillin-binding transpeptidase domain-containing protein [Blastocatellia bacterium]